VIPTILSSSNSLPFFDFLLSLYHQPFFATMLKFFHKSRGSDAQKKPKPSQKKPKEPKPSRKEPNEPKPARSTEDMLNYPFPLTEQQAREVELFIKKSEWVATIFC
jgi:hypothetical protein